MLIKKGADVNATNKEGLTALHRATDNSNVEVLSVLLRHGAKVTLEWSEDCMYSVFHKGQGFGQRLIRIQRQGYRGSAS